MLTLYIEVVININTFMLTPMYDACWANILCHHISDRLSLYSILVP